MAQTRLRLEQEVTRAPRGEPPRSGAGIPAIELFADQPFYSCAQNGARAQAWCRGTGIAASGLTLRNAQRVF
jgi:hypothetical protein